MINYDDHLIEITQPVGTFYIRKMNSSELIKYFYVNTRIDNQGIQRPASKKRISDIADYCTDPDAAFPTPIILAVDSKKYYNYINNSTTNEKIFEIIDGQHRVKGIQLAQSRNGFTCDLLVVLMFDLTDEEKAYIFSTINSNQARVDKSLIYDLFDLSTERSPLKTCHYIARIMNSTAGSPFYNRLKMLGKKESDSHTLSQGAFVNGLVQLISKKPQQDMLDIKNKKTLIDNELPFRRFFISNEDELILKIIKNFFNGVKKAFPEEWESDDYILTKSTGYLGLIQSFEHFYKIGVAQGTLSESFFTDIFVNVNKRLKKDKQELTSKYFSAGAAGQSKLKNTVIEAYTSELSTKNNIE